MNPDNLNQIHDVHQNNSPTPDEAPSFNVRFLLEIDTYRSSYMYLTEANNYVTKFHKGIYSKFLR